MQIVPFSVGDFICALPVEQVRSVEFACEITGLPNAPEVIAGVINFHGDLLPVIDMRHRLGAAKRELILNNRFLIVGEGDRNYALWVDGIEGTVREVDFDENVKSVVGVERLPYVKGIVEVGGEVILIHDLDQFLSLEECERLDEALREVAH